MDHLLNDAHVRILGSLIEKEKTTPAYYPLSLNALTAACNQVSNRDPVVHFDEEMVAAAVEDLRKQNLVHQIKRSDSRVTKYQHVMAETMNLSAPEIGVMCVLMLRGPQTIGEIRTRTNRLFDFASLDDVEAAMNGLIGRAPLPLVVRLPRRPGQKEVRYAHALSGDVTFDSPDATATTVPTDVERIGALEEGLEGLQKEVADLRLQLEQFRMQFEESPTTPQVQ